MRSESVDGLDRLILSLRTPLARSLSPPMNETHNPLQVMDVCEEDMSQVFKAVAGVLNCGNVIFRDVLDTDKTTEVVGVLDEQAEAKEYAR